MTAVVAQAAFAPDIAISSRSRFGDDIWHLDGIRPGSNRGDYSLDWSFTVATGRTPSGREPSQAQSARAGGQRGAVERYAKAFDEIERMRGSGLAVMPHQKVALDRAREALDAIRPHASADLGAAFQRSPELVLEAAEGRGQVALKAMQLEAEIRIDPFQRADRFVEGWQQLQRHHQELVRDGNLRGAKTTAQHMTAMVKGLERDAQLESVLGLRSRELGLERGEKMSRSLSRDLAASIPLDHGRDIGRGMSR